METQPQDNLRSKLGRSRGGHGIAKTNATIASQGKPPVPRPVSAPPTVIPSSSASLSSAIFDETSSGRTVSSSFPTSTERGGSKPRPRDVGIGKENEALTGTKKAAVSRPNPRPKHGHGSGSGASKRKCETNSFNAKSARHTQTHHATSTRRPMCRSNAKNQPPSAAAASGLTTARTSLTGTRGAPRVVVESASVTKSSPSSSPLHAATQTDHWLTQSTATQTEKGSGVIDDAMITTFDADGMGCASTAEIERADHDDAMDITKGHTHGPQEADESNDDHEDEDNDGDDDGGDEIDDDEDEDEHHDASGNNNHENRGVMNENVTLRSRKRGSAKSRRVRAGLVSVQVQTTPEIDVKPECSSVGASTCTESEFTEETVMQTSSPDSASTMTTRTHRDESHSQRRRNIHQVQVQHCAIQTDHQGWMAPPQEVLDALRFGNSLLEQKTAQLEGKVNMLEATLTLKERQLVMEREDFAKRVVEVEQAMQSGLVQSVARIRELERELAAARLSSASVPRSTKSSDAEPAPKTRASSPTSSPEGKAQGADE
ncbi:Hypothetical Protein FCC1311_096792 [Hondaea fermentalgiana]|uniref:Uncharacterized protein n=1 Tax=Hondaea fermentalgiana TaxID=2315210 RepID=A0A2R5GRE6_9STRA|nr:Hypothetical Protein FCC1311_096792 [Hondaea fermentalgiana]|eukprot:GBG33456.1 Hypothetical Protein FCC1311_096792 [Hondaea fermentalgiana]